MPTAIWTSRPPCFSSPSFAITLSSTGNKRLGFLALVVFYGLNGVDVDVPDDTAYDLVIDVATSAITYEEAAERLASWRTWSPENQDS